MADKILDPLNAIHAIHSLIHLALGQKEGEKTVIENEFTTTTVTKKRNSTKVPLQKYVDLLSQKKSVEAASFLAENPSIADAVRRVTKNIGVPKLVKFARDGGIIQNLYEMVKLYENSKWDIVDPPTITEALDWMIECKISDPYRKLHCADFPDAGRARRPLTTPTLELLKRYIKNNETGPFKHSLHNDLFQRTWKSELRKAGLTHLKEVK